MVSEKNSKKFVVVIDQDKIEPDIARETVINFDPLNRAGKEGGFYIDENEELHIDEEDVMEAHKMAINKYPYDDAIKMIQLPSEEGEKVHQFHENSFRLYGLPAPSQGSVVGIIGENGTGKSVALKILAGEIKPNLGDWKAENIDWDQILKRYRGTELQDHFKHLSEEDVTAAFKPQKVEEIPKVHEGTVENLLEKVAERKDVEDVATNLDIDHLLTRKIEVLSGGELQRVAIASTILKDADVYMIDEPSSFLDVKQRLKMGREITNLGDEKPVLTVEHDLATLDLISDRVNIFFGDPGSYGMVSNSLSSKNGVNRYLEGYLPSDNIRIRSNKIKFDRSKRSEVENKAVIAEFPKFEKDFGEGEFSLETEKGKIHEEEILAVFGENGLGKTVFAKILAGAIEPDSGKSPDIDISYKPQYLKSNDKNVETVLNEVTNVESRRFETRIEEPLRLESLYSQKLDELSGGELQRIGIAVCLARDADMYLLDEPSAYLDVESRVDIARTLKRFARKTGNPLMVIDHDLLLLDYISDRGIVFKGASGDEGLSNSPKKIGEALNNFLKEVEITFRKDPNTGRPRANKPESQKDVQQRKEGIYYEQ